MPEIQQLNKLEKLLNSFGVHCNPRQTSQGEISLPILYQGDRFHAVLSCMGGTPTEEWWGQCSATVKSRIREHFRAFLTVDSL
ncbi:MAG: hypothetical protein KME28_16100 [Pelatocladus maniniholoensis HA4357-MV3]|jgi:hypothetical protein|uniref:Uncharacterized protein n=1 Tax=Pelatocladus maniniholoensis HA4357-MV3 TaxID=1117104 RepID=A0A9E3LU22_9NOST|nr:hypothetical protein [Pelatocladus maniniholoensis HA4357-MV3]